MKYVCGLGNPGPEYAATRHNVGWWALDLAREAWRFPPFTREGSALVSGGEVDGQEVLLLKPLTYMNRSGLALAPLRALEDFEPATALMVVVDDVALPVGRLRFRARGSAGGHNGLKSIEAVLGTQEYPRLRIGVGAPPPGSDRADWVLSGFSEADENAILELLPDAVEGLRVWLAEGIEAAMSRFNR